MSAHHEDWHKAATHHHGEANRHVENATKEDARQSVGLGIIAAILSLVNVQFGIYVETRRIRGLLEERNATVWFNPTATLIPKDGGPPVPIPTLNPTETQDVQVTIAPTNRGGSPTTGPFAWTAANDQITPQPSADGKTCVGVTGAGAIDTALIVTDTVSGNTETYVVQRTVQPPPDNVTTSFNASGSVVDKTPAPPTT